MDRWKYIKRPYSVEDVESLKDIFNVKHTISDNSSQKLWKLLNEEEPVRALGALTGGQAVQMVKAGLKSVYISGWQVAADNNLYEDTYPDMGIYPPSSLLSIVRRMNNAFRRYSQIDKMNGFVNNNWLCPLVVDMEAGFGGTFNTFELTKKLIEAGAAGIHLEDQNSASRRCGHLGGKVLVPTKEFIKKLVTARLAADVLEVPTVIIARTDADSANLITSDADECDHEFIDFDSRTSDGFYSLKGTGMERCIARGLAYAPYCDLIWMETSKPSLEQAREFAEAVHGKYPGKMLAYNCSPSFNWKANLSKKEMCNFQKELGKLNYKYQFVTLAGFHSLNYGMFNLALSYNAQGMYAYSRLQQDEFLMEEAGYTATKHQKEVGTSYFDKVRQIIDGNSEMGALKGSTEEEQF